VRRMKLMFSFTSRNHAVAVPPFSLLDGSGLVRQH
jgi:hypothetical protein